MLKSKGPYFLLNQKINFNKNQKESKMENTLLERRTLCFTSYKNRELRVKLCWVGAYERKKRAFFVSFVLSKGKIL